MGHLHERLILAVNRLVANQASSSNHGWIVPSSCQRKDSQPSPSCAHGRMIRTISNEERDVLRDALLGFSHLPVGHRLRSIIVREDSAIVSRLHIVRKVNDPAFKTGLRITHLIEG